jgi:hypothetical protein
VRTANNRKFVVDGSGHTPGLKVGDAVSAVITGFTNTTFLTGQ